MIVDGKYQLFRRPYKYKATLPDDRIEVIRDERRGTWFVIMSHYTKRGLYHCWGESEQKMDPKDHKLVEELTRLRMHVARAELGMPDWYEIKDLDCDIFSHQRWEDAIDD